MCSQTQGRRMSSGRKRRLCHHPVTSRAALIVALLMSLLLSGCQYLVIVPNPPQSSLETRPAVVRAPSTSPDVGILAIEFDPPLTANSPLQSEQDITLRVAVANFGQGQAVALPVRASLEALEDDEVIMEGVGFIDSLAPGETGVVTFTGAASIPLRTGYRLEIEVAPVRGEMRTGDNHRIYEIEVLKDRPSMQP